MHKTNRDYVLKCNTYLILLLLLCSELRMKGWEYDLVQSNYEIKTVRNYEGLWMQLKNSHYCTYQHERYLIWLLGLLWEERDLRQNLRCCSRVSRRHRMPFCFVRKWRTLSLSNSKIANEEFQFYRSKTLTESRSEK